jgi:hypothetical protein
VGEGQDADLVLGVEIEIDDGVREPREQAPSGAEALGYTRDRSPCCRALENVCKHRLEAREQVVTQSCTPSLVPRGSGF